MKKILFSVMTVVLVLGLVGAGAFAYFSDVETSTGNTFTAGTIDLEMNDANPCSSAIFTFPDIKPCHEREIVIKMKNVGNNNGYLYQKIEYVDKDKLIDDKDADEAPDFEFASVNHDSVNNPEAIDLTADEFAALIYVKEAIFNLYIDGVLSSQCPRSDMAGFDYIDENVGNNDGKCSLYEIKKAGWLPYSSDYPENLGDPDDTLQVGHEATWTITFHMADSLQGRTWGDGEPIEPIELAVEDNAPQADGIELTWTAILRQNPNSVNPLP